MDSSDFRLGTIHISTRSGGAPIPLIAGRAVYILGRNGTGKSALVHNLVSQLPKSIYIPGSRPSYFDNDSLQMTPAVRRQMENNWMAWDRQPSTRYRPMSGTQRNERAILDLQSSETQFKVDAANEVRNPATRERAIARLENSLSPFDRMNNILRQANFPVEVIMGGSEMQARRESEPYSIAKMSDGERAALIVTSDVLSAPLGSIFLIDEPELHLHRSIVVPLIAALLRERPDCSFIISTHELELPSHGSEGIVVLVRGCSWNGDHVMNWDVDVLSSIDGVPDDLRVDLLGSRRKILFVEGQGTSLDQPFYAMLFPSASVRPKGTARDVKNAVGALKNLEGIHHASPYGLVDNDTLLPEQIEALQQEKVFALPIASIESLYYCTESVAAVARSQSATLGIPAHELVASAKSSALSTLSAVARQEHLASYIAVLKFRNLLLGASPSKDDIVHACDREIKFSVKSNYSSELARLRDYIRRDDYEAIVAKYPIRESPMLNAVAAALRFRERADYERAVITRLGMDTIFVEAMKTKLAPPHRTIKLNAPDFLPQLTNKSAPRSGVRLRR